MKMTATVLAMAILAADASKADDLPPVLPGSRVRLETPAGTLTGNVLRWDADRVSLINTGLGDPYLVPTESISKMELSRERKKPILKSALIGAAIGGGFMAVVPMENPCPEGVQPSLNGCETRGNNVVIGVLGGAGWGAIIGALRGTDRWEEVPRGRFRIAAGPIPGGVAGAVTVSR